MSESVYRKTRKKAAERNSELNSAENAQDYVYIERTRLLKIENNETIPHPEEVSQMMEVYDAPQLGNYYCTQQCPIGKGGSLLIYDNLSHISVALMTALHSLKKVEDGVYRILEDGVVSESEQPEFRKILETLEKIAFSADSLKLWAQSNGIA